MNFKEYITESTIHSKISDYLPIGWWKDEPIYLFHGTRLATWKEKIEPSGALLPNIWTKPTDRTYKKVYVALDPYTARGYGAMAGEWDYKTKAKAKQKEILDRYGEKVILVFKFDNIEEFNKLNFSESSEKWKLLKDRKYYDEWIAKNNEKIDFKFYEMAELWSYNKIPLSYLDKIIFTGEM